MNKRWTDQEMQRMAKYLLAWYDEVRTRDPKVANIYRAVSNVCNYLEGSDYPDEYESDELRHEEIQHEYSRVYNSLWHYAHR